MNVKAWMGGHGANNERINAMAVARNRVNSAGSTRHRWKQLDKMLRIFRCHAGFMQRVN